jgi:creatinine amidohydrolase
MTMTWLARAHFDSSWAHLPTTDFPAVASRPGALAVLPVHGFADHGMGLPLDLEEVIAGPLLADATAQAAASCSPCVLPPLRFGPAPYPSCGWFGVDLDTAHELVLEIARGVKFAGFEKLLLFSTNPWHREWLDDAARNVRVETGLVTYRVHLGSLGLDFHPAAPAAQRLALQALGVGLLGFHPVASAPQESSDGDFRPGKWSHPPPLAAARVSPERAAEAEALRGQCAERLARLLTEAAWHGRGHPPRAAVAPAAPAPRPGTEAAPLWRPFGSRYLGGLHREALRQATQRPGSLVVLPTGAIEQHGPHLPVGVDSMLGQGLLTRALALLAPGLPVHVAPPIVVGKSNEHADWPGTLSLSTRTFAALVRSQVGQLHRLGFQRIAIWNTHGGNSAVLVPLIRELQGLPGLRIGMLQNDFKPAQSPQEAAYGFHAGEWETALMLALAPALVRRAKAVCHYPAQLDDAGELRPGGSALTFGWTTRDIAPQGVIGDPTLATSERGETWANESASALASRITRLVRG